jgi:hypothetical protein
MEGEVLTFYRLGGLTCNGREGGSSMLGGVGSATIVRFNGDVWAGRA